MDPDTVNPANTVEYDFDTSSRDTSAESANDPGLAVEVKFGGNGEGETRGVIYNKGDNWLTFAGFYYLCKGNSQGEIISFMDFEDVSGWPCIC